MAREIKGTIDSITEKYIYTTEVLFIEEEEWFVHFGPRSWSCTVYSTREAAEAARSYEERVWNKKTTHVRMAKHTRIIIKHHRYKRQ